VACAVLPPQMHRVLAAWQHSRRQDGVLELWLLHVCTPPQLISSVLHIHTHIRTHRHAHAHTHTYTHISAHTHIHTHTCGRRPAHLRAAAPAAQPVAPDAPRPQWREGVYSHLHAAPAHRQPPAGERGGLGWGGTAGHALLWRLSKRWCLRMYVCAYVCMCTCVRMCMCMWSCCHLHTAPAHLLPVLTLPMNTLPMNIPSPGWHPYPNPNSNPNPNLCSHPNSHLYLPGWHPYPCHKHNLNPSLYLSLNLTLTLTQTITHLAGTTHRGASPGCAPCCPPCCAWCCSSCWWRRTSASWCVPRPTLGCWCRLCCCLLCG